MKTFRITVLTMVLLVGATSRSVPTAEDTSQGALTIAGTAGECYLINGIWFCEPD